MHRPELVTIIINLLSDSVTHILAVLLPEMVPRLLVRVFRFKVVIFFFLPFNPS